MTVLSILEMISPIYHLARKPSGNIQPIHTLDGDGNDTYSRSVITPRDEYIHGDIKDDTHGALVLKNYIDNEFAKMVTYEEQLCKIVNMALSLCNHCKEINHECVCSRNG